MQKEFDFNPDWSSTLTGFNDSKHKLENKDQELALADVVFVVLCLANQTGINLQEAFDKKLDLKSNRDKDRHKNNEKLK